MCSSDSRLRHRQSPTSFDLRMSDNRGNLSRPHFEARYTDTAIAKADKSVCVAVIVTQYDINLKYADAVGVGDLRV